METAGGRVLEDLWERVGAEASGDAPIPSRGLKLDVSKLADGVDCCVIALPEPKRVPEAYLVAAVHRPSTARNRFRKNELARYFTLELGRDLEGGTRSVLCEWKRDQTHVNMGTGPDPTTEAFRERINQLIGDE